MSDEAAADLTVPVMTGTNAVAAQLTERLDLLGADPISVRFRVAVDRSVSVLACRTHHRDPHETEVGLAGLAVLGGDDSCRCPVTAATMAPWCTDPDLSVALMATVQLAALRDLIDRAGYVPVRPRDGVQPLLQHTVTMLGHRSMVELTLDGLFAFPTGPYHGVLVSLGQQVRDHMDGTHRRVMTSQPVRTVLQRAAGGRDADPAWVLLAPVRFRFSDDREMRDRTLAWALLASWAPQVLRSPELVMIPGWVYAHLRHHLPASVRSRAYPSLPEEVRQTAMTLWQDALDEGRDDFDSCLSTADLLCR